MPRVIGPFQQRILTFVQESADRGDGVSLADISQAMSPDSSIPASAAISAQTQTAVAGLLDRELLAEGLPILESSELGSGLGLYYPQPLPEAINARIRTELVRRWDAERERAPESQLEEYRAAMQAVGGDPNTITPMVSSMPNQANRAVAGDPIAAKPAVSRMTRAEALALVDRILRDPSAR